MKKFDVTQPINLILHKLQGWGESAIAMLPNLVVAVAVLLLVIFAARFIRRGVNAILTRTTASLAIADLGSTLAWLIFLSCGMFVALEIVGLEKAVASLLAGLGIVGIALGFAFQDIATNFMSGILIALQKPYTVGDIIKASSFTGEVTKIELRITRIRTFDGLEVIIPNKDLFTQALINYTSTPDRRLSLQVGISYGENLSNVMEITRNALQNVTGVSPGRPIDIYYQGFGASSIDFVVHIWITYPGHQHVFKAPHDAILAIKAAFDKHGIVIPFPIRTLDFGIKGGQMLEQSLAAAGMAPDKLTNHQ